MDVPVRWHQWQPVLMTVVAILSAREAKAQVCAALVDEHEVLVGVERQVDFVRYVHEANVRIVGQARTIEFEVERIDKLGEFEDWKVTFEPDAKYDYVRRLEIDGAWMHTVKSHVVNGVQRVTIATPKASVKLTPDEQPGNPNFELFRALALDTAQHREALGALFSDMPPWDYPPLQCVADCLDSALPCGEIPDCGTPYQPSVCDCWGAFECCMSEYLSWHLCGLNCICTLCYDGFVEECCAQLGITQSMVQFDCEQRFLKCLTLPGLGPCPKPQPAE